MTNSPDGARTLLVLKTKIRGEKLEQQPRGRKARLCSAGAGGGRDRGEDKAEAEERCTSNGGSNCENEKEFRSGKTAHPKTGVTASEKQQR
jgi:hypothetical protein